MSRDAVEVYAHWQPIDQPLLVGMLTFSDSSRAEQVIKQAAFNV